VDAGYVRVSLIFLSKPMIKTERTVKGRPGCVMAVSQNYLRLGDVAPDFEADTSLGRIQWHKYIEGKWAVLFSHPKDFTPVCTTELARVAQLKHEWARRNTVICGLSVDSVADHHKWLVDINEFGKCTVDYPLIDDASKKVAGLYGMLDPNMTQPGLPLTVRSVFIIGLDKKIKLTLTYPASTGRNFDELLRCIDSLQLTANRSVATPADWKKGQDVVILPAIKDPEAQKMFPGFRAIKPYLRLTPDPSVTRDCGNPSAEMSVSAPAAAVTGGCTATAKTQ